MRRSDGAVEPLTEFPGRTRSGGAPRHALPRAVRTRSAVERRILALGGLAVCLVAALVALGPSLPAWCAAIAIAVRLTSSGQYAVAVARRRARPNIVTWLLWGLTPMIAVAAQIDRPGPEVAVTAVLGIGPLVVAAVAFRTDRSASRLTPFTLGCAAASIVGIVMWQLTSMPELAIAFCILADLLATLPTLRKAYGAPESEYAPPYLLSVLAMLVTIGTVEDGGIVAYGFPVYMLSINVVLFAFAALPLSRILRRTAARGRHGIPRGYRTGGVAVPHRWPAL